MRTEVRVIGGPFRGRAGSIAGTLEDRAARGVTKALVRFSPAAGDVEMIETRNLSLSVQIEMPFPRARLRRRRFIGLNPW